MGGGRGAEEERKTRVCRFNKETLHRWKKKMKKKKKATAKRGEKAEQQMPLSIT